MTAVQRFDEEVGALATRDETTVVSATRVVPAPLRDVWDAVVSSERRQQWWPGFDFEARAGGELDEAWRDGDGTVHHTRGTILRVYDRSAMSLQTSRTRQSPRTHTR